MKRLDVYFDGACWLWKKAGFGFIVKQGDIWVHNDYGAVPCTPQTATNNVAEHYAAYRALKWLLDSGYAHEEIVLQGDSKMVVSQLFRGWRCRDTSLPYYPYMEANKQLLAEFTNIRGKLLPREHNQHTDDLSKKGIRCEVRDEPISESLGRLF